MRGQAFLAAPTLPVGRFQPQATEGFIDLDRHRGGLAAADAQAGHAALAAALFSAPISVTRMRAPEAPIGWPSAQAPPFVHLVVRQA